MLRREFPFKISIAGSPPELVRNFMLELGDIEVNSLQSNSLTERRIEINSVLVRLHLKRLHLESQINNSRLRDFHGSIGMIYIFDKMDIKYFNEVKRDYALFKHLYDTVDVQPVFISIGKIDSETQSAINDDLANLNLSLHEFKTLNREKLTQFLQSLISKSKSFISTTQGSCDVELD